MTVRTSMCANVPVGNTPRDMIILWPIAESSDVSKSHFYLEVIFQEFIS